MKIDSMFKRVFEMALKIANETNGSFDPTIAPLVNFWGFGFEEISNKNQNKLAKKSFISNKIIEKVKEHLDQKECRAWQQEKSLGGRIPENVESLIPH